MHHSKCFVMLVMLTVQSNCRRSHCGPSQHLRLRRIQKRYPETVYPRHHYRWNYHSNHSLQQRYWWSIWWLLLLFPSQCHCSVKMKNRRVERSVPFQTYHRDRIDRTMSLIEPIAATVILMLIYFLLFWYCSTIAAYYCAPLVYSFGHCRP